VATVQPRRLFGSDEELGTVCVFTGVGHGQPARAIMLQLEVFVLKPVAIDTNAAGAVALGEIASLDHEVPDDPVELAAFVPLAFGLLRQLDEVFGRLRHGRAEHSDFHALRFFRAQLDVEPHLQRPGEKPSITNRSRATTVNISVNNRDDGSILTTSVTLGPSFFDGSSSAWPYITTKTAKTVNGRTAHFTSAMILYVDGIQFFRENDAKQCATKMARADDACHGLPFSVVLARDE